MSLISNPYSLFPKMLMLLFYVGNDRYAINSSHVVEIIPRVMLRKLHHAPDYIAGIFNYRGKIVPVIDLCHLIQNNPSRSYLSTRIIMLNYEHHNSMQYLGLMAERVTETVNKPETELVSPGIQPDKAPYLGDMIIDNQGMIQQVRVEYLLVDTQLAQLLPRHDN